MAQIFHPSMNIVAKATIFGAVFFVGAATWGAWILVHSSYVTDVETVRDQPVPFSHQHHVGELGLDCRFCHTSVETSAFAGMPTTEICMSCHSQIWKNSKMLEPVRESARTGRALEWTRIHDLPDFVYFNHRIHIAKGIGCASCHGNVNEMPLMRKSATLFMEWCIACHRHPESAVREQSEIYQFDIRPRDKSDFDSHRDEANVDSNKSTTEKSNVEHMLKFVHSGTFAFAKDSHEFPAPDQAEEAVRLTGPELVLRYGIVTKQLTDCVICHR